MKNVQFLTRLFSTIVMLFGINQIKAQDTPTFLKTDNQFIQQRIEKSDPEGWLFFKASANLGEGDLFKFHKTAAGLSANDSMHLVESTQDDQGYTHNRYQQYYRSIKVEDAEFFEHIKDCKVELMHGKIIESLSFNPTPTLSQQQALNAAKTFLGASQYAWESTAWEQELKDDTGDPNATYYPSGNLVLAYPFGVSMATVNYQLAWKFEILALSPGIHKTVYVNAQTGSIIKSFDVGDSNGPAVTLYDGTQTIDTKWFGGLFHGHHHDAGKKIKTRNGNAFNTSGFALSWSNLNHIFDSDDIWASDQSNNTSAHWGVNRAWDYFKTTFGRNGMNNSNNEVRVFAGSTRAGAFSFNREGIEHLEFGTSAPFGGTTNFASLDVCGHEFTHGIVRNEANFGPAGEPGALNESFADIFGTLVENFQRGGAINWTIAEDAFTLRDMQTPAAFGDPATYLTDPFWTTVVGCIPTTGSMGNDQCGIHSNCGVQNRWFFLLTQGGTQNGVTVQGIGSSSAARITYSNLCNFLGSASGYPASRLGSIAAARQIFGPCSNEEIQTTNAWAAVGVGLPFAGPCITVNGPTELCADGPIGSPTFTAWGMPGATFTWNFPPGWTANTTGTGNKTLEVTNIPAYPSYPTSVTIDVTSSLGGTATIVVTLEDCGSGGPWKCTDGGGDDRGQSQKASKTAEPYIALFPNPSKNQITVQSNGQKIEKIKVFDITGELIYDNKASADSQVSIDVTRFSAGTYFVSIQFNNETVTKRFVKVD
jgi:bacillolysin